MPRDFSRALYFTNYWCFRCRLLKSRQARCWWCGKKCTRSTLPRVMKVQRPNSDLSPEACFISPKTVLAHSIRLESDYWIFLSHRLKQSFKSFERGRPPFRVVSVVIAEETNQGPALGLAFKNLASLGWVVFAFQAEGPGSQVHWRSHSHPLHNSRRFNYRDIFTLKYCNTNYRMFVLQRGLICEFDGNFAEAKNCYEGATSLEPDNLRGLQQLVI